jgi:hypothetical protein
MGRLGGAALGVALLVGSLSAPAVAERGPGTRTETGNYLMPSISAFQCQKDNSVGCVVLTPEGNERFIHVEVKDASGMAVYAYVNQDADGDGYSDIDGPICGQTDYPLRITPRVPVRVFILPAYTFCPGAIATQGTVEGIFGTSYGAVWKAARD